MDPAKVDLVFFVAFQGEDLGVNIPEKLGGGRQARVTNAGTILCARQFAAVHGFELPPEPQAGDVELSFDGPDYG